MLLQDFKPNFWSWMYAERYLGDQTRSYSQFSADTDIYPQYRPVSEQKTFIVPTKRLRLDQGSFYKQKFGQALQALYFGDKEFILPIHPAIYGDTEVIFMSEVLAAPDGPKLTVVPTASVRTVLVTEVDRNPVEPHFIKLHYPKRISRFIRRLRRKVTQLQLWVSNELYAGGINHLPEVGAGLVGHDPVESWGFIIRSALPLEPPSFSALTMPLFALYGGDHHHPDDPPLAVQLIDGSGQQPLTWFERHIAEPLAEMWCNGALKLGLLLEIHGQNGLIQIAPDSSNSQLVYRDCDVYIDYDWRRGSGRSLKNLPKSVIGRDETTDRKRMISLIYDGYIGHHMLQYLAITISDHYGVSLAKFQQVMRQQIGRYGQQLLHDFPTSEYYYADKLYEDNNWRLVDTRIKPRWRP